MYLGPATLSDFDKALRLEWLVTNGLGGYASSTVLNINTRKYHGILVAAFNPPIDRHVVLSKLDEDVTIEDKNFPLGSNEFKDTIYPNGFSRLRSFSQNPFPTFNYEVLGLYLRKILFMPYARNMTVARYDVINTLNEEVTIQIYPLVNMRHFYETTNRQTKQVQFIKTRVTNGVMLETQPPQGNLILVSTNGQYNFTQDAWIERLFYRTDDSRGENCVDDYFQHGFFSVKIPSKAKKKFSIAASAGRSKEDSTAQLGLEFDASFVEKLFSEEMKRRKRVLESFYENRANVAPKSWLNWLLMSANSFIVKRKSTGKKSIIAGYHWFEDWGRDALISLPGLTLVTKQFEDAEEILLTFKQYCRDGLVPNRFPDRSGDEPVYDSVDASLWFINAIYEYSKYTGRLDFVRRELWQTMQNIIEHYINGTLFSIHMDDDGLILHGPRLTWMDASIEGKPVTPRGGKAVEIQALWYNALKIMETLAQRFNQIDESNRYRSIAERTRFSFNQKFWWSEGNCLYDTVENGKKDPSLRPNQIIAVSLSFCMLEDAKTEKIVEAVWKTLFGSYGLKTLSSNDPNYVGSYKGGFVDRDRAYHNGTVWAWLLGPFITAFLKVKKHKVSWRKFAFEKFLQPLFFEEIQRAGIGCLSEIFDGNPPHASRGCISQAWSVAEPLRAYMEDILMERPPFETNFGT
jgi:predicted glycogen debranching enzyme